MERRLAAILAADVAGYSRLMGVDEAGTLARLRAMLEEVVRPSVSAQGGRIVKQTGDGFLAEYPSAVGAVRSAIDIQAEMERRNEATEPEWWIALRIGVNLGDIIVEDGDIYGDGVNVAARLEGAANPGGICISGTVHEMIGGALHADFVDLGERTFKNIARPIRVFRLGPDAAPPEPDAPPARPDRPSIAVLNFSERGANPTDRYLADGIAEDIITELSRFPELFVIAPTSSLNLTGTEQTPEAAALALGVRYLLTGSVRRMGERLRISARLVDSDDGSQVWGERFDSQTADLFELQDDITRKVVGSIAPHIEQAELARSRSMTGDNLTAYELAMKAQALGYEALRVADRGTLEQAIDIADEALSVDQDSTRALWVRCLCMIYQHMYHWGDDADGLLATVSEMTDRLFRIDSANAKAFMLRAWVRLYQGRFDAALADHQRSLDLNPNLAMNLFAMSWTEAVVGMTDEARAHAELALRLSPREADVWVGEGHAAIALACLLDGQYREAVRWGNLAYQRQPGLQTLLVAANLKLGDRASARHHFEMVEGFAPKFVRSCLDGSMRICRDAEHNEILIDALRAFAR